jgi:hypothetical protein
MFVACCAICCQEVHCLFCHYLSLCQNLLNGAIIPSGAEDDFGTGFSKPLLRACMLSMGDPAVARNHCACRQDIYPNVKFQYSILEICMFGKNSAH